jgi:MFS family permease
MMHPPCVNYSQTLAYAMATPSRLRAFYAFSFLKNLQFFGALAVPFYLYRLKFNYGRMFILEAIFSVAMMLLEVPTGVVADKWGRKVSLLLGSLFLALGFFAFGVFRAFWVLVVGEVVCAMGMTFVSGADKAFLYEFLAAESREDEASRIFSRYEAAGTAGLFLAFPLGSLFAGSGILPYEQALGLVFVFTAAAMALSGAALLGVKESHTARADGGFLRHGVEGFLIIFRKKSLRNFGLDYAAISALTFFMFWFYQSLLAREGVPVSWNGFAGAGFNLGATLLLSATGPLQKRFGARKILFFSSLIPGILYIVTGTVHGLVVALIAMSGIVMLKLFRAPMLSAAMNTLISDDHRATVLSGISMVERILIALMYPLVGALADYSLNLTLIILGCLTILASLVLRVGRLRGDEAPATAPGAVKTGGQ